MAKFIYGLPFLVVLASIFLFANQSHPVSLRKPTFMLVGGKATQEEIKRKFIELAGGKRARIIIVPTASSLPNITQSELEFWNNVKHIQILNIQSREQANDEELLDIIDDATGIWFSGGDQARLSQICHNTLFEKKLYQMAEEGAVIGGTSAGASIMSKLMIVGASSMEGFGLLENYIVDQHFSNRNRLSRLKKLIQSNPDKIGIGIDEGTFVVIQGNKMFINGIGTVTIVISGSDDRIYKPGEEVVIATN